MNECETGNESSCSTKHLFCSSSTHTYIRKEKGEYERRELHSITNKGAKGHAVLTSCPFGRHGTGGRTVIFLIIVGEDVLDNHRISLNPSGIGAGREEILDRQNLECIGLCKKLNEYI